MRRAVSAILCFLLALYLIGCGDSAGQPTGSGAAGTAQSYRDIPGVTEAEIAAIEALRSERAFFSFGQMEETEAFILPDGTYAGFAALFCDTLTRLFDIPFVLEIYDWETLKSGIDQGRIDFTGDLTPTPGRMLEYYMSYPIAERSLRLFQHIGSNPILTEKDINGLRVGSLVGAIDLDDVREYYPDLVFTEVMVDNFETAARMLESGGIDVFVTEGVIDPIFDEYGFIRSKEFFPLVYTPVSLTTANPGLKPVIDILNKYLSAGGIDALFDSYKQGDRDYARSKLDKSLSAEARAYLHDLTDRNVPVRVALEQDNYPVSFYDSTEKSFQGIAVDVLREIGELTGITFIVVNDEKMPWAEIMAMLKSGEASLVSQLLYSEERKGHFLWTDVPYASSSYALLSKFEYPTLANYQVVRTTVGTIEDSAFEDKYNEWFPGNENTVLYSSQDEVLDALESGEVELLMGSEYLLLMQQNYREKPGYKINIRFSEPMDSYFGFHIAETQLCAVFNEAQRFVNVAAISDDWTSRGYDYTKQLTRQRMYYLLGTTAVMLIVLILAVYLLIKNRRINQSLDKRVNEMTLDLQASVTRTEAALAQTEDALHALEAAQRTVSSMFEANPQINVLFNSSFKVIDCNPAAYIYMGFETKEEMIDGFVERFAANIPPYQSDGRVSMTIPERMMTAAKEGYARFDTELVMGGKIRVLNMELKRISYENSFAIVAYVYDMTEDREREKELLYRDQQLREAVEEAKAANQAKSAFLSNMSHEIRTPLNAILGITEIQFQNEMLDPGVKEAFDKIYNSGDLLLGIINDILDLSKIEAGKLELSPYQYEIASLINDTAQINMMRIGSKPIHFELQLDENTPATLVGDELRVRQILNNLLSNAFKYTDAGEVVLSIFPDADREDEDEVMMVFRVSDTGQGMTQEQVGRLFDEYSRFNQEANRTTEGTGLGMSITQNLVRMMGGTIEVSSTPGEGSVFTVFIPQGKTDSGILGRDLAESLRQFRAGSKEYMKRVQITREPMPYGSVLVVDDVETNIYVAKGLLAPYGLRIDSADSGLTAIEKIREGNLYDLVFMDHMMPGMDGIEAVQRIRLSGYTNPIVALTANAVVGQSEIFLTSGFDDFISKPIDIRQLNTVLNKMIRDKQPQEVVTEARRQAVDRQTADVTVTQSQAVDPRFAGAFARDAAKALAVLEAIAERWNENQAYDEEDIKAYIINVHGMKSALANIGQLGLSAVALKLEHAGRENQTDVMVAETPAFLAALRAYVGELSPGEDKVVAGEDEEDRPYLLEKLGEIRLACEGFDKKAARNILQDLVARPWSQPVRELLDTISEHLLHSDFDEVAALTDSPVLRLD